MNLANEQTERPRRHHYLFSHDWLADDFAAMPELMLRRLRKADPIAPLRKSWKRLGRHLGEHERLPDDSTFGLDHFSVTHEDCTDFFSVVSMPEPQRPREAHFVCLVARTDDGELRPEGEDGIRDGTEIGYFVLERAPNAAETRLCMCKSNSRLDLGSGPSPELGAFIDTIIHQISPQVSS